MAELGHEVLGVDVDETKIAALSAGRVPFFEPGLPEILTRTVESGRLNFTTSYEEAADFAHVHFLGVGTPQTHGSYAADLTYVYAAIDTLVPLLRGDHIIFGKSTVPVGTAADLQARVDRLAPEGTHVEIVWNPEFLREGFAVKDTISPDRIVLGTDAPDSPAIDTAREIYAQPLSQGTPFVLTNLPTAELVKVSANSFLATKISFINAVSEICEVTGADVVKLAEAIGYDDRIGKKFLRAGLGFGGGCLPKDIRAFMARAGELGASEALSFLREVDSINMRRREHVVELSKLLCDGSLLGKNITVLGAAFKPNSDDVRDSPALSVAGSLSLKGANVTVYDPQAMGNAAKVFPTLDYAQDVNDALTGADLTILATEWDEFRQLDPQKAGELVNRRVMLDARNVLQTSDWCEKGWQVKALGRGE